MNKIIVTLALLFTGFCFVANAQIDRSKAPEPGIAPKINIGTPSSFTLENGLKFLLLRIINCQKSLFSLLLIKIQ